MVNAILIEFNPQHSPQSIVAQQLSNIRIAPAGSHFLPLPEGAPPPRSTWVPAVGKTGTRAFSGPAQLGLGTPSKAARAADLFDSPLIPMAAVSEALHIEALHIEALHIYEASMEPLL